MSRQFLWRPRHRDAAGAATAVWRWRKGRDYRWQRDLHVYRGKTHMLDHILHLFCTFQELTDLLLHSATSAD